MRAVVGQTLASVTDTTTVIVVRAPGDDVDITCGGVAMTDPGSAADKVPADPAHVNGTLIGKRYENAAGTLELLCTKGGSSSLAYDGQQLTLKIAKPLPASD